MTRRTTRLALATITPALLTGGVALAATSGGSGPASGHAGHPGAGRHRGAPVLALRHPLRSRLTSADIRLDVGGRVRDFRFDKGTITAITPTAVTLTELDSTSVTVPLDAQTKVREAGRAATVADVHPGEVAVTMRVDGGPATRLRARAPGTGRTVHP